MQQLPCLSCCQSFVFFHYRYVSSRDFFSMALVLVMRKIANIAAAQS